MTNSTITKLMVDPEINLDEIQNLQLETMLNELQELFECKRCIDMAIDRYTKSAALRCDAKVKAALELKPVGTTSIHLNESFSLKVAVDKKSVWDAKKLENLRPQLEMIGVDTAKMFKVQIDVPAKTYKASSQNVRDLLDTCKEEIIKPARFTVVRR